MDSLNQDVSRCEHKIHTANYSIRVLGKKQTVVHRVLSKGKY